MGVGHRWGERAREGGDGELAAEDVEDAKGHGEGDDQAGEDDGGGDVRRWQTAPILMQENFFKAGLG